MGEHESNFTSPLLPPFTSTSHAGGEGSGDHEDAKVQTKKQKYEISFAIVNYRPSGPMH